MLKFYKGTVLLFLLALVSAFGWNSWNIAAMRDLPDAGQRLRAEFTVATADDVSYLRPVDELLEGMAEDTPAVRPPGYGIWYLILRLFLDPNDAVILIALLQVVLFAASVALLYYTLQAFGIPPLIRAGSVLLFAILPTFQGFLFYTLTEGVTPAYVLICVCCALMFHQRGDQKWLIAGTMTWALLLLTRPVLGWAGLPLLVAAYFARSGHGSRKAGITVALATLPLFGWVGYESITSGYFTGLHPVYRPDATNVFRPTHKAFWELAKSWGM